MDETGRVHGEDRQDAAEAARRVFLGWDAPALERAAEWLLAEGGSDLEGWLVVLPGSRAARRLRELLARRAPADGRPPRIVTQGVLSDELLRLERPVAERLTRNLVWAAALDDVPAATRRRIARRGGADARGRRRLAETVRALHAELAREGRSFADLAGGAGGPELEDEAARWQALAAVQSAYRRRLAELGLEDPHEGRWRAIEAGRVDASREIVLIGVVQTDGLTARLLDHVRDRVTALVVAPDREAATFDGFGRLRVEAWKERDVDLPLERWRLGAGPADQAEIVERELAAWSAAQGGLACDRVTVGVADEEVAPYLERRLAARGARARHASGTPITRSRPLRLLRALQRHLQRGGFAELAELARDPDLQRALPSGTDPARDLDDYQRRHLPRGGRGPWVADTKRTAAVEALERGLGDLLGELASGERRPIHEWPAAVRAFLQRVYPDTLDPEIERERLLALALGELGRGLGGLEAVPEAAAREPLTAGEALELLGDTVEDAGLPPAPARPGETVVELLGWLELFLDDAPFLAVTGFNEGRVPASPGGDAFLPDGLRRGLGLPSDDERLARDAYVATVLLASRREILFVSGRRSAAGDPLVPSRLAFHRPAEDVPAAVARAFPKDEEPAAAAGPEDFGDRDDACPAVERTPPVTRMSVTSFRTYLDSPYAFLLQHVLGVESVDDDGRELDPLAFGNLAHAALEDFGRSDLRDSADADAIAGFLSKRVDALVRARYGREPLPAVLLQREQLRYRLGVFARRQAERRRAGWRIAHVEWAPPAQAARLELDGGETMELSGRIDRIDLHADGRMAVLDYKTGEKAKRPKTAHRKRDGTWTDLQLPLYHHLTRVLDPAGPVELGYVQLGKEDAAIAFAVEEWDDGLLAEGLAEARRVAGLVRAGEFRDPGKPPRDEVFQAIWGVGRVAVPSAAEDGDGEEDTA